MPCEQEHGAEGWVVAAEDRRQGLSGGWVQFAAVYVPGWILTTFLRWLLQGADQEVSAPRDEKTARIFRFPGKREHIGYRSQSQYSVISCRFLSARFLSLL